MQRARVRVLLCKLARIDGRLFFGADLPRAKHRGLLVVVAVRVVLFLLLAVGAGAARGSVGRTAMDRDSLKQRGHHNEFGEKIFVTIFFSNNNSSGRL